MMDEQQRALDKQEEEKDATPPQRRQASPPQDTTTADAKRIASLFPKQRFALMSVMDRRQQTKGPWAIRLWGVVKSKKHAEDVIKKLRDMSDDARAANIYAVSLNEWGLFPPPSEMDPSRTAYAEDELQSIMTDYRQAQERAKQAQDERRAQLKKAAAPAPTTASDAPVDDRIAQAMEEMRTRHESKCRKRIVERYMQEEAVAHEADLSPAARAAIDAALVSEMMRLRMTVERDPTTGDVVVRKRVLPNDGSLDATPTEQLAMPLSEDRDRALRTAPSVADPHRQLFDYRREVERLQQQRKP